MNKQFIKLEKEYQNTQSETVDRIILFSQLKENVKFYYDRDN